MLFSVFVTNSSSLQKRVKIIMREDDENKDDVNDAKLKPKKKNKMLLHRVGSGLIDVATTTSGLTASAVSTLVPNPGGAIDVLVVENRSTKSLRCTPFFVRFGNAKSFFSKKLLSADATYVSFQVNGKAFEQFRMKLSRNGTCQFAHENCAQDALFFDGWDETTKTVETTASTSMVKTRMDGENANANGNYGSLLNETESIAIEEAEEAGRSSEDDEEEDGEEEEAPKAPLTSSEATTTTKAKTTTTTTANAASSGKYTRAKKWLKTKVGGLSGNHSSGGSKHSNSADKNNNNNNNNNGKEKKEAKAAKPPRKRRNTRLTSDELKMLDLKPGLNTVTYSYKSRVFGTQTLECNLFLWDSGDKVVVSDIDGTITKSDVLGHIYTMVGKDYAHPGIASLYRKVVRNGYKILFVTSRAISQSNSTRAYLRTLTQNGETLPIGPVMCAPDPISTALYREVVARKPEVFKIRCLTRVRRLFDVDINKTRMFAGFGNRSSDALAYKTCGIELDKIYTIDPKSRLRSEKTGETFEIQHLMDKVDQAFPRIEGRTQNEDEEEEEVEVAARWRITAEDKERKKGEESRVKCLFTVEEKSQAVHCSLFIE